MIQLKPFTPDFTRWKSDWSISRVHKFPAAFQFCSTRENPGSGRQKTRRKPVAPDENPSHAARRKKKSKTATASEPLGMAMMLIHGATPASETATLNPSIGAAPFTGSHCVATRRHSALRSVVKNEIAAKMKTNRPAKRPFQLLPRYWAREAQKRELGNESNKRRYGGPVKLGWTR